MSHDPDVTSNAVEVTVTRTGGIAGMRREWHAQAASDEASRWRELIEQCPWGTAAIADAGADRFRWRIEVQSTDDTHRIDLIESQLTAPWRALIAAVRAENP